jgi:hypothetical protein
MLQYIDALKEQQTIRRAAASIGISVNTSFCWRHKLLSSLHTSNIMPTHAPAGACQINLPHSCKGKRNIPDTPQPVTRTFLIADAQGIPCLQLLPPNCTALEASKTLRSVLPQTSNIAFVPAKLLTRALRFAECMYLKHKASRKKLIVKARRTVTELNKWMYRFRGVATKYLQQYWNWFRVLTNAFTDEQFTVSCISRRQLMNYRQLIRT